MKALFFDEPKKPVVSQVQSPSITPNEVMIRSRRVGICHSDYELLAGQYIIPISYPVIPGHEWVGEVVEVGKNVTGLKSGDRVVGRVRDQDAGAHPPLRLLHGWRKPRVFPGPARMAPQAA